MRKLLYALRIFLFSTLFFLSAPGGLLSQAPGAYPENPADFVSKLGDYMTASKRPDLEESYAVFRKLYNGGAFSEQKIKRVIRTANLMAEQKLVAFPHYKNYINAVSAAIADPDTSVFNRWQSMTEQTLASIQGKVKQTGAFLEFCADFMEYRALKTGEGGSTTWKIQGGRFEFGFREKQPVVQIEGAALIGLRKKDSVVVRNSSAEFFPLEGIWRGTKGVLTWAETGLDSTVRADLLSWKVDVVKPLILCDSAQLHYPLYFGAKTMPGKLEHNVYIDNKGGSPFPRFESFDKSIRITKIGEGIEYVGGFRLSGSSLYGYGVGLEPAQLTVYNNKRKRVFYGTAPLFIIKREQSVVAENVNANLLMAEDSLFHPNVNVRIDIPGQAIHLTRGDKGTERTPFFSSYYNMNLNAEKISWYLLRDSVEIGSRNNMAKGLEQTIQLESSNRYNDVDYLKMQMTASHNPIATLYGLSRERGSNIVNDNDFARKINPDFDYSSIQTLLATMVTEGFINYYFDKHEIELRDKLKHYAIASKGQKDYDNLNIVSTSTSTNAKLDMKTKELQVNAVDKIEISKLQRVAVIPHRKQLTLLKNRDMNFDGRLFAGFALFEGNKMRFSYDRFQVDFDSVQHLDFYLPTGQKNDKGQPGAVAMNSTIENLSGVLIVDAPNNKSGKEDLGVFPSLQSKKNSYVYYDRKDIVFGEYTRDSFFFRLDPFAFNALDNYTKDQLKFKGAMFPATIFPDFRETIFVRDEDKSFGFIHKVPAQGYPVYSGKGQYGGELDLSNRGLRGKGKLNYLSAEVESEDFLFRPKRTTGTAKKFFMAEDRDGTVKLPQASGVNVSVNWLPFRDSLYVESKTDAFQVFKTPGYSHRGLLILTPTGLKARGVLDWDGGRLTSKLMAYGPFRAQADTADLQIKAIDGKGVVFDSRNVKGKVDFDSLTAYFRNNVLTAFTELPYDKYKTTMNEFTWDLRAQSVDFKKLENKPGYFISTDPDRDSLAFEGETAFYDIKSNQLYIDGVNYIKSADAFIHPDSGYVEIESGGKMKQLENARIVADTINKYHTISRATVNISGKKEYTATGYYVYDIPSRKQEVFFNNIRGERRGGGSRSTKNVLTSADGDIAEEDSFRIDQKAFFKGKIILEANKPNVRFEGFAKLDAPKLPSMNWFSLYAQVDKTDPAIKTQNAKDEEGNPLFTGFFLSKEMGEMYPRILAVPYARVDRPILDCQGVVKYDNKNDKFIFGDSAKVVLGAITGAKMVYENKINVAQAEGPLKLGSGLKYMKIKGAGRLKADYNTATDSTGYTVTGEFMTGTDITMPKNLFDLMLNDIKASSFDATMSIYNNNTAFYQPAVCEFVSAEKERGNVLANLQNNLIDLPKADNKFSFLLGRHSVIWNAEYQSFLSLEDKIPVISINGEPIGKMLNAYVEYKMPMNEDDRFYLYIKASPDLWYFFGYQAGVLNVVSSSTRFNDVLATMKPKDLQIKMADGELYEIVLANPSVAEAFVNRVKAGRKKN